MSTTTTTTTTTSRTTTSSGSSSSSLDASFVLVTVEEVELSLESVVALPSSEPVGEEGEEEEDAGLVLEARVRATKQVARVHEMALLTRAAEARALARHLNTGSFSPSSRTKDADSDSDDEQAKADLKRQAALDPLLAAAAAECHLEFWSATTNPRDAASDAAFAKLRSASEIAAFARRAGGRVTFRRRVERPPKRSTPTPSKMRRRVSSDASEAQARKDIERDSVIVVSGGRSTTRQAASYEDVVATLANAAKRLVRRADATEWRPNIDGSDLTSLAKLALRAVNRTESGGVAFDALASLIDGRLLPVPDSKNASPLKIDLGLGPCRDTAAHYFDDDDDDVDDVDDDKTSAENSGSAYAWRWGLYARVEGVTKYNLFDASASPDGDLSHGPLATATAVYRNHLLLPLDSLDKNANSKKKKKLRRGDGSAHHHDDDVTTDVLYDRANASVTIHVDVVASTSS